MKKILPCDGVVEAMPLQIMVAIYHPLAMVVPVLVRAQDLPQVLALVQEVSLQAMAAHLHNPLSFIPPPPPDL
jgi:hypothetical protein